MRHNQLRPGRDIVIRNTCSEANVDRRFMLLIEPVVGACRDALADRVLAIRLLGSVPRGDAIVGRSDIDFMALVDGPVPPAALDALDRSATRLQSAYPVVTKVDLEANPIDELSEFQRFVLSSDSVNLYGVDTLTRRQQTIERARLAALVTPPAHALIQDYRAAVASLDALDDADAVRFYSRVTGKDLLKCLRFSALMRGGTYERSIDRIYTQVLAYVPEYRRLAEKLFALYRNPQTDKDAVLAVLTEAEKGIERVTLKPQ